MPNRREILKHLTRVGASFAAIPLFGGCATGRPDPKQDPAGVLVNDVHSQLNPTRVRQVCRATSDQDLRKILARAASANEQVSLCGSRHSMGGQQFGSDTVLVDVSSLKRVLKLDREKRMIEVEAGISWPALITWLNENAPELSIIQKQTGADEMTLAGALSANIHGRGLAQKPIIQDIESFTLIVASGDELVCSRDQNSALFQLAIGGYGLFGIIATVQLRLMERIALERVVTIRQVADLDLAIEERIANGYMFGDFQFMTDAMSDGFIRQGVFSCYCPAKGDAPPPANRQQLTASQWEQLYLLAHVDKAKAYKEYRDFYLRTNGQVYWSDHHQLSTYLENQNIALNKTLGHDYRSSLMISELYVPRKRLSDFMENARSAALKNQMDIIYGTIRFIEKDDESFLAWAKDDFACIIFNLHVIHTAEGLAKAQRDFRQLIDVALALGGSYYLTYHRWARKDQVLRAYPQFPDFLRAKKQYDPEERFVSDWYRHYKQILP